MKHTSNERGVLPVLVALLVVVLIAVGAAVYNANKALNKDTKSVSVSPSPASLPVSTASPAAVDPYAGWQMYKSSSSGISFKYPADWKIVANNSSQVDIAPSQGDAVFQSGI